MKKILPVIIILITSVVVNAQSLWELLTSQENASVSDANSFGSVCFINANTGFVAGTKGMAGGIFKTEDGGKTWTNILTTGVFDSFSDICILKNGVIWAGGSKGSAAGSLLYKSTNNGVSWTSIPLPENIGVKCFYFANDNEGWIIQSKSGTSRIYNTTDGGNSWSVQMNGTTSDGWTLKDLFCCYFFDNKKGIVAGNYGNIIYTTDGGKTWNYRNSPISTQLWDINFIDQNNGWICGGSGNLLSTTDGGTSWAKQSLGVTQDLKGIHFTDKKIGWVVGGKSGANQGIIYSTIDGGINWIKQPLPNNRDLNNIFFLNNSGWIAGNYGTIYHLGTATSIYKTADLNYGYQLEQNYPNPFNPMTMIGFQIPKAGFVSLKVYDIIGKEVANLISEFRGAGNYNVSFDARSLQSGVYVYTLKSNNFSQSRKMLLMK